MSNIIPFRFEENEVRVMDRAGESWFVLADVCWALGLRNPSTAAVRLDDDEKTTIDTVNNTEGVTDPRAQSVTIINESGLYSLILSSRKPAAKRFKKWVTAELLPTLRRRGGFTFSDVHELLEQAAMEPSEVVYVYVVENVDTGTVKVGISKDPDSRFPGIQTGTHHQLRLAHISRPADLSAERRVHGLLAGSRIRGEWFDVKVETAIKAIDAVVY